MTAPTASPAVMDKVPSGSLNDWVAGSAPVMRRLRDVVRTSLTKPAALRGGGLFLARIALVAFWLSVLRIPTGRDRWAPAKSAGHQRHTPNHVHSTVWRSLAKEAEARETAAHKLAAD
jgi:hypothetical protein